MNGTISLSLIVRDVEKTIDKCLSTFRECVDEIIVVDTGSVDNTIPIVKRYTNKIYHFKWIDDFSAARNFCLDKCIKDFILWVDGDDFILPEDIKKIRNLDYSGKEIIICQYVYAVDEFGQPSCIVPRERIFKRSLGLRWSQPIHEYLPIIGRQMFVTDIRTYHQKQHGTSERNLRMLENIVQKNPGDSRNIYYLGVELLDFGKVDEGIKQLKEFIKRGDGFWEDIYKAHFRLAQTYMNQDEFKFKIQLPCKIHCSLYVEINIGKQIRFIDDAKVRRLEHVRIFQGFVIAFRHTDHNHAFLFSQVKHRRADQVSHVID